MQSFDAAKADGWSVGVALLELLINRYPFDKVGVEERLHKWNADYFDAKLKQIPALRNPPPDTLRAVIKGLLNLNPSTRLSVDQALKMPCFQRPELQFSSHQALKEAFGNLKNLPKTAAIQVTSIPKTQNENYADVYLTKINALRSQSNTNNASTEEEIYYINRAPEKNHLYANK